MFHQNSTTYAIQDLDCGLTLSSSKGKRNRFKSVGPIGKVKHHAGFNFETRLANEAFTFLFCMPLRTRNLVAGRQDGDELGFESLAKRHQRRIFALAFRYTTRFAEDAEDIVQRNFRKAFQSTCSKFEGDKSSFSTWLTRICHHTKPDVAAQATRTARGAGRGFLATWALERSNTEPDAWRAPSLRRARNLFPTPRGRSLSSIYSDQAARNYALARYLRSDSPGSTAMGLMLTRGLVELIDAVHQNRVLVDLVARQIFHEALADPV